MYHLFSFFSLGVVAMSQHCAVHYSGYDNYSKIKEVSEINHQRFREVKALRKNLECDD